MKLKLYKILVLVTICFFQSIFSQKFDKKYTESFKTNKDVEVVINASNTAINVTTWNKNELQVEAFIEIEGLEKEAAEKYFKNWNFEALGNTKTVKIVSKLDKMTGLENDFILFNCTDFTIPEIEIPDFEAIVIPEINFDFDFDKLLSEIKDLDTYIGEFKNYSFNYKDGDFDINIDSKEELEKFKKSKEYKKLKEKLKIDKEKLREEFTESKEKLKKDLEDSRKKMYEIDEQQMIEELAKAKEHLKALKLNFSQNSDDIIVDGKKIKIIKKLEIKVPQNATFNLNTNHCKIKLPNTVAFGNIKYGTFDANNLEKSNLTIDYSPVNINNVNTCSLSLNNVTDAKIVSVANTSFCNNSSGINIVNVGTNVTLSDRFGQISIASFHPDFKEFVLNLNYSDAKIDMGNVPAVLTYKTDNSKINNKNSELNSKKRGTSNKIILTADYSTIVIK